jgi:two-component system cell cycle sensor histidine kinase/response regulator CckA
MSAPSHPEVSPFPLGILLVEDDEARFYYFRSLLGKICGGRVLLDHAPSHELALRAVLQNAYSLVLCDYRPGNGEAPGLLRDYRSVAPSAAVVFLSDCTDESAILSSLQANAAANPKIKMGILADGSLLQEVCGAIAAYCRERQHRKSEDMLRKLSRAVEQTADLVVITDRSGLMEYVNPAFEALTGYSPAEAIGQSFRILKSEQQSPELYKEMWETILAGKVFRGVFVNRKRNGEIFRVEKTITPLRDAQGNLTHFISTDRDITERQKLETQLQQAQKMDAIGRLAGGVAHDFNNLLMVISAYAELMLEALAIEHPLRRNVQEISTAAGRAADLTRQLLAFGRKQMQSLRELDLNVVVHEISRMLLRLIREDIQLNVIPGNNLGKVWADPVQIEQVLMNLAANARDAMPRGGRLTIETANVYLDDGYTQAHSIVPPGDYIQLAVTDSGHGISSEHISHIFEPFYTTKEEGHGTGLGLATVYGIVKQSGGFIWVYSEPGMGTTFKIYLPRVRAKNQKREPASPAEIILQGCETLLLVEDAAGVRQSEKEFLEMRGYKVLEAENGMEALLVARSYSETIHLMITDVIMPQLGGVKLAEQLAVERPQMDVLFVSGYAENTVLQHGPIDIGGRFLQKPFTLKSLARKIRYVLGKDQPVLLSPITQ